MPEYWMNGLTNSSTGFLGTGTTAFSQLYCRVGTPSSSGIPKDPNNNAWIQFTGARMFVNGNGGSRTIQLAIWEMPTSFPASGSTVNYALLGRTDSFTVTSETATTLPTTTRNFTTPILFQKLENNTGINPYILAGFWNANTNVYYGRVPQTGTVLGYDNNNNGTTATAIDRYNTSTNSPATIVGKITYRTLPTSPASFTVTPGQESASFSWSAPSDIGNGSDGLGGASITGYRVEWSTSSNFSTITSSRNYGGSSTSGSATGIAAGTYYFRIAARNQVADAASTTSVWRTTGQITIQPSVVNYTVTFDGNQGTTPSSQTVVAGNSITLPSSTRTGYTLAGWYTASSGGTRVGGSGSTYTPPSSITLYAQWTTNKFTLSYNANGGTGTMASTVWEYPDSFGTVASNGFTRNGFIFAGWGTSAGATTASYQPGNTYFASTSTASGSATLYAIWTAANPVFSDITITPTGTLGRDISLNQDRTVSATPVIGYSVQYAGTGLNPVSWLTIDPVGQLSGIPPEIGVYTFQIIASNGVDKNTPSGLLSLTISPAGKRFNGSSFIQLSTAKKFDGGTWANLTTMKRWNGSSWIAIN